MRPTLTCATAASFLLLLGGCDNPVTQPLSPVPNEPSLASVIDDAVGKIAYLVGAGGFDFDIYVGNPDGTGLVDVSGSDDWDTGPIFSPNARRIVFASNREGDDFASDIFVMNADGDDVRRLTSFGSAGNPHWSPSGRHIAFESGHDDPGFDVYIMNADGGDVVNLTDGVVNLTNELASDGKPLWSPNGGRIAFTSDRDREVSFSEFDIFVMDADGGNVRRLTTAPDGSWDIPWSWSPDGKQIAFYRTGLTGSDVYLVNVDGSGETSLADGSLGAWSPNGQQITFSRNNRPFIMYADGSGATAIPLPTEMDGKIVHPYDWSHR